MMLGLFSFLIIVGRAYLHFQGLIAYAVALDLSSLLVFTLLIMAKRERIYLGIVTYLPSVSLYLFIQENSISDLSLVTLLLTVCVLFHVKKPVMFQKEGTVIYFFAVYVLLLVAYLFTNYINFYLEAKLQPSFLRFLDYLVLTIYASFAFWLVYRKEDNNKIADAFIVAACAYLISCTMGYFYLEHLNMSEYAGDITKELFRYPGFSNSNYIGNAILLMTAIAYSVKRNYMYLYVSLVALTAFLSQSRSVLIAGIVFLSYCVAYGMFHNRINYKSLAKNAAVALCCLGALFTIILQDDKLQNIATEYTERILFHTATENITERVSAVQAGVQEATDTFKNLFFGLGYVREGGNNPHNSIIQALLLFGFIQTLVLVAYFSYLIWKIPVAFFALLASFAEILFFTSSYDFLFFILIAVNVYKPPQLNDGTAERTPA